MLDNLNDRSVFGDMPAGQAYSTPAVQKLAHHVTLSTFSPSSMQHASYRSSFNPCLPCTVLLPGYIRLILSL
jgi:hypothetical protein